MKYIFIFFWMINTTACIPLQHNSSTVNSGKKEDYKITFFKECLKYSYSNEGLINEVLKEDNSSQADFNLTRSQYSEIRKLAQTISSEVKNDSILIENRFCLNCPDEERIRMKNEGIIGKRPLKFCLDFYESDTLDSLSTRASLNN